MYTEAFDALDYLESIGGRNEKLAHLKANKDNEALKKILFWAYSGEKYYTHLDSVDFSDVDHTEENERQKSFETFEALLSSLKNREVTGGDAEKATSKVFLSCDSRESKWFHRVMQHDLRIGCTKNSVTKVFGKAFWGSSATENNSYGFIEVMLSDNWETAQDRYVAGRYFMEPKYDGYRLEAIIDNGKVTFYSRQGKSEPYTTNLKHVAEQLIDAGFDNCMVDGEIMKDSWGGTGIVKKKTLTDKQRESLAKVTFLCFDYLNFEHFNGDIYTIPFNQRREQLCDFLQETDYVNVKLTESVLVTSEEEALKIHAAHRSAGHEGSMVKAEHGVYVFGKRSDDWVKMKPVHTIDGKIVGFELGKATGKNAKRLGAFVVQDAKGQTYKCGQGIKDKDRDLFWDRREQLLGTIVEMKAQDDTNSKTGPVATARNAVFLRLREDREGIL